MAGANNTNVSTPNINPSHFGLWNNVEISLLRAGTVSEAVIAAKRMECETQTEKKKRRTEVRRCEKTLQVLAATPKHQN
jgi:hypothetical protein